MSDQCGLCCGICRLCCFSTYQCCCSDEAPSLPTYEVICIGVTNAGKSTLLAALANENMDTIVPTVGFSIKDIKLTNAVLKVRELGGADNIRPFWTRYYSNIEGVIFVIDGMCTHEQLDVTSKEIHQALQHSILRPLPWLILCNKQDLEGACTHQRVIEELHIGEAMRENPNILVKSCSKTNKDRLLTVFEAFGDLLIRFYSPGEENAAIPRV